MRNPCGAGSPCAPGRGPATRGESPCSPGDQSAAAPAVLARQPRAAAAIPPRPARPARPKPLLAGIRARRAAGKPVRSGQPLRTGALVIGPDAAERIKHEALLQRLVTIYRAPNEQAMYDAAAEATACMRALADGGTNPVTEVLQGATCGRGVGAFSARRRVRSATA